MNGISEGIYASLVDFVAQVWDKTTTRDTYWEQRRCEHRNNPFASEGGLPLALLVDNERVVGHVASVPCKVWASGKESLMFWNAGLYLLDECRGKGLGNILPQKMIDELPIVTGFFVVEQQLKTHDKMGWTIVGKLPEYIKIIAPYRVLRSLDLSSINQMPEWVRKLTRKSNTILRVPTAFIGACAIRSYNFILKCFKGRHFHTHNITVVDEFDERIDELWIRVRDSIPCAQVRNSEYMNWSLKSRMDGSRLYMRKKES